VQKLLTALIGEQLKDPLAGLGGGRLHTAGAIQFDGSKVTSGILVKP
jgi:hypothetical protein